MQIIKIPLLILFFFIIFFLESFLLRVFSFSIFIILVFSMWKRTKDLFVYPFITLFSIILDSVTHTPLGSHILVLAILLLLLDFLWLMIPRDGKFGFIPIFISVFLYYLLVPISSSLLQDFVFPNLSSLSLVTVILNSSVSVGIWVLIEYFTRFLRDDSSRSSIRLS